MRKLEDVITFIGRHNIIDIEENSLRNYLVSKYGDNPIIKRVRPYWKIGEEVSFIELVEFINEEDEKKIELKDIYNLLNEILNILKNIDYENKAKERDCSCNNADTGEDKGAEQ